MFTRDGALWTLGYGGLTVRMRDAKGLADLAVLLASPGREVPAADLVAAAGAVRPRGPTCASARTRYSTRPRAWQIRARMADLASEIAEAESWNDPERAARARQERDVLLRELAVAAGRADVPACSATRQNAPARRSRPGSVTSSAGSSRCIPRSARTCGPA